MDSPAHVDLLERELVLSVQSMCISITTPTHYCLVHRTTWAYLCHLWTYSTYKIHISTLDMYV